MHNKVILSILTVSKQLKRVRLYTIRWIMKSIKSAIVKLYIVAYYCENKNYKILKNVRNLKF